MNDWAHSDLPAAFSRAQQKIERWRRRHRPRARIADVLWREAAELASAYGINRTAKALRRDYYSLKRRVAAAAATAAAGCGEVACIAAGSGASAPQFVEVLGGPMGAGRGECLIEVQDAGGVKMRIRLGAGERPDLLALARVFREGREGRS